MKPWNELKLWGIGLEVILQAPPKLLKKSMEKVQDLLVIQNNTLNVLSTNLDLLALLLIDNARLNLIRAAHCKNTMWDSGKSHLPL